MAKFASRKFILALLVILAATALCVLGFIDGQTWAMACGGALTVHAAGNVSQKVWADEP